MLLHISSNSHSREPLELLGGVRRNRTVDFFWVKSVEGGRRGHSTYLSKLASGWELHSLGWLRGSKCSHTSSAFPDDLHSLSPGLACHQIWNEASVGARSRASAKRPPSQVLERRQNSQVQWDQCPPLWISGLPFATLEKPFWPRFLGYRYLLLPKAGQMQIS